MRRPLATLALALAAAATAPAAGASTPVKPRTPIEHFVMLMQEGHSFDNYFGTYPGADGIPKGTCMPVDPGRSGGRCVKPFRLGDRSASLPHSAATAAAQADGGRMDGFVKSQADLGVQDPRAPMGHYDGRDLPFYWNLADQYVLFDRFFAASAGGSVSNHLEWLTAGSGDPRYPDLIPPGGFGAIPTVIDRLEERGVSWKVYVQDYNAAITFRSNGRDGPTTQATWMPLLSFRRYVDDPATRRHIGDLSEYFTDADRGTLPSVAFVVPASSSEHPPGRPQAGQRLVRRIVGSLLLSPLWRSSAFLWTYDTWGGWYDHVRPPKGRGFRVPALLVSAWARRHRVDHTPLDTTSPLRFIEVNWRLRALRPHDRRARTFFDAFDFSAGPRPAVIPALGRTHRGPERVRRAVIYGGYGGAALLAFALIGGGVLVPPARRRIRRARRRRLRGSWR